MSKRIYNSDSESDSHESKQPRRNEPRKIIAKPLQGTPEEQELANLKREAQVLYDNKKGQDGEFNEIIYNWAKCTYIEYPIKFNDYLCSYIYCIRVYVRQGFQINGRTEYFSYKIGKCDDDPRQRCKSLNKTFESQYEIDNKNLLFIFVLKISVGGPTHRKSETNFLKKMSSYNTKEFTEKKLTTESFRICPESFELMIHHLRAAHKKDKYWMTERYDINDNVYSENYGHETFDDECLGSLLHYEEKTVKDVEEKDYVYEDDASHDEVDSNDDSDYEDTDSENSDSDEDVENSDSVEEVKDDDIVDLAELDDTDDESDDDIVDLAESDDSDDEADNELDDSDDEADDELDDSDDEY